MGRIEGGLTDELVCLVSVGVECVCVKGVLVLVLVLCWTHVSHKEQATPQYGWLPKKNLAAGPAG